MLGRVVSLVVAAMLAAVGTGGLAKPAQASGPTDLGIVDYARIVIDPATSHIFISSPSSNSVVVTDLSGNLVTTITGEAGAGGMVVVGTTVYVALTTAGSIDRI